MRSADETIMMSTEGVLYRHWYRHRDREIVTSVPLQLYLSPLVLACKPTPGTSRPTAAALGHPLRRATDSTCAEPVHIHKFTQQTVTRCRDLRRTHTVTTAPLRALLSAAVVLASGSLAPQASLSQREGVSCGRPRCAPRSAWVRSPHAGAARTEPLISCRNHSVAGGAEFGAKSASGNCPVALAAASSCGTSPSSNLPARAAMYATASDAPTATAAA